jgi:hypothetical protein
MRDRFTYEISSSTNNDKGFLVAVHHYRHLGPVSTREEIEFDTFKDLVDWLRENVNAQG